MENLDDVLNGQSAEEVIEQEPEGVKPESEAKAEEPESQPPSEKDEDEKFPHAAVKAIRTERNDWKERAIKAEAAAEAFKSMQQPQQEQEPVERNPFEIIQEEILKERFNRSKMFAQSKHEDLEKKESAFLLMLDRDPSLRDEILNQSDPYGWLVKKVTQLQLLQEIGDDPESYRKKVEEEIRANLTKEPAVKLNIPQSLAGARSTGSRASSTWTGQTSLDSILKT